MADPRPPGDFNDAHVLQPPPIAGVPTDIAGFVGVTAHGSPDPTLVTSWAEFQRLFGGFVDRPSYATPYWRLPYAVRGFFENGGQRAYVARVLDPMRGGGPGDLAGVMGDAAVTASRTGIAGLMTRSDVSLVAVPDDVVSPAFAAALVHQCDTARDRVAILNDPTGTPAAGSCPDARGSQFSARYYPQLHVLAQHLPSGYAVVPACGHVAGILARLPVTSGAHGDGGALELDGVIEAGHPSGAGPLDRLVTAADADRLVLLGSNVIRDFRAAGRGVRLWGARTMSSDPEWKYVSVRRLFLFLEQSIDRGIRWAEVEPNTERTWAAVRAAIATFLRGQWRNGALAGSTTDEAFFVRCDHTTMTQDDLDHGRLACLVGVAPLRPAEFVIIRIGLWTADHEP